MRTVEPGNRAARWSVRFVAGIVRFSSDHETLARSATGKTRAGSVHFGFAP
jgi:hypothetical protein